MNGTIEDSFDSMGAGRIVGEDGFRYDFEKSDCLVTFETIPGVSVEFEPSGSRATSVRLLGSHVAITGVPDHASSKEIQVSNIPGSGSWLFVMIPFIFFFRLSSYHLADLSFAYEYFWIVFVCVILGVNFYVLNRILFAWRQVRRFGGGHLSTAGIVARAVIPIYQIYGIPSLYMRITDELNEIHGRAESCIPKIDKRFAVVAGLLHIALLLSTNAISNDFYIEAMANPVSFYGSTVLIALLTQTAFGHMVLQRANFLERMKP